MDPLPDSPMLIDPEELENNDEKADVAIIGPQQLDEDEDQEETERADDLEGTKRLVLKELPDLETEDEVINTWTVENWRGLPRRTHGPVFMAGGHPWRVLLFPFGNNTDCASLYLEQAHDDKPQPEWYACVQFALVMWNPNDPSVKSFLPATHRFTAEEGDWGFTRFAEIRKLFAPRWEQRDHPMIEKQTVNVSAYVRVVKDPTGVLWHNFVNYDSKKETGYVGLRNQGATCYLNSLLQSLYFTNAFRKAIYQIPTKDDESPTNSAYTLQRLFFQIQVSNDAVPTTELTRSFGWDSKQIFEQQDVQELCRILMERMEMKMKGTEAENALARLFVGKMKTYISCINVDFESSRIEDFWDIQLTVSGNRNLDDSLRDYVQVEIMDGDNKYFAEGYGLQDARKGVIFDSFPQVLHLQLKRFEYDVRRDATMKVNDRYEFPEFFDATPYLSDDADRSESYIYQLHGVLVHSGDFNAGHYYAFLKPTKDGPFYKFDDDRVTRATLKEVLEENYGGDYNMPNGSTGVRNPYTRTLSTKRSMSAYMLVYIRQSRLDEVLVPVTREDAPPQLQRRLDEERAQREQRKREREEQHLYLSVGVVTDESFKHYQGFDLTNWESDPAKDPAAPKFYRILRSTTIKELTGKVAEDTGQDPDFVRLWAMVNRQNQTIRPDQYLKQPDMTVDEAHAKHGTKHSAFRIWAEVTTADGEGKPVWPDLQPQVPGQQEIVIFVKYFDAKAQSLRGVGHLYTSRRARVSELVQPILRLMGWPDDTAIDLFEEIKPIMVEPLKPTQMLVQAEIQDGDILCFGRVLTEQEVSSVQQTEGHMDAREFYDYLCNRLTVRFVPKHAVDREQEAFELTLSKRTVYDRVAAKVGERLGVDPTHLRFFTVNMTTGNPKTVVKRNLSLTLLQMLTPPYAVYGAARIGSSLFFEVLDLSLSELETKKPLKINWITDGISKEESVEILAPKIGTVADVAALLERKVNLPDGSRDRVRIYEVHSNKIHRALSHKVAVTNISEYVSLFAELIPDEELETFDESTRFIDVFHFNREPTRAHGVPFRFLLISGEPFNQTKERLEKRTGFRGKQFEKIKFAVVARNTAFAKPMYLNDEDVLFELTATGDNLLGLDHLDRSKGLLSSRNDGIMIR